MIANIDPTAPLHSTVMMERALTQLVHNAVTSRSKFLNQIFDPRRDINDECGYPSSTGLDSHDYKELYDREAIATRVVNVMPKESWQVQPRVFETQDALETTPFEDGWNALGNNLDGGSRLKADEGSPIWEYLLRADILSGIGSFGVILLGVDDGKDLDQPITPKEGMKLLFMRAFDQTLVGIPQYERNMASPRFGQPFMYTLTFNDPNAPTDHSGTGLPLADKQVHWSRVIHLADNLGSSEIFGIPRMRPVLNRLLDLRKLYGGSAEMYWKGAFPGLSIESHPQLGTDVDFNLSEHKNQMEQMMNGLQRYIELTGASAKMLAPTVVDPSPQIQVQLQAVTILLGIPMRVFVGSEVGQLASSQDDAKWNDRLRDRQRLYITPKIISPFVDRCIDIGVLPEPESGNYNIIWPDISIESDEEAALVADRRTKAMGNYVTKDVSSIIGPTDYLVREMGFTPDEAEEIAKSVVLIQPEIEEDSFASDLKFIGATSVTSNSYLSSSKPTQNTIHEEEEIDSSDDVDGVLGGSEKTSIEGKHHIKLPENRQDVDLDIATEALSAMGYQIFPPTISKSKDGKFEMSFKLESPSQSPSVVSSSAIKDIIYEGVC